jgi:hypothetical protein
MFRRSISPPSLRQKNKSSKKPEWNISSPLNMVATSFSEIFVEILYNVRLLQWTKNF